LEGNLGQIGAQTRSVSIQKMALQGTARILRGVLPRNLNWQSNDDDDDDDY